LERIILLLIILNLVSINLLHSKWTNARDPGVFEDLYALKFVDKDTGFAAGWSRYGTILKTTNGGEDWVKRDSLPYQIFSLNTLDGVRIYAAGSSLINECGLLLLSTDQGKNWIPDLFDGKDRPYSYGFYTIELLNSQTYLMSGLNGIIVKTTNGGVKWDTVHTGVNNEVFTIMDFVDENIGYAASGAESDYENINKIYKTTDGGNNWFVIKERDSLLRIGTIEFVNADVGYLFGKLNSRAVVLKTVDGGQNWLTNYNGRDNYMLAAADIVNENFILTAGEKNYVIRTTDGGQTWVEENTGGVGEGYISVDCVDEYYGYIGATRGLIMKYDLFLDVEENAYDMTDVKLYPNPIDDIGFIQLDETNFQSYQLKIFDVIGYDALTLSGITGNKIELNLRNLKPGIYFYSLILDNKKTITGKLIKL